MSQARQKSWKQSMIVLDGVDIVGVDVEVGDEGGVVRVVVDVVSVG